MKEKNRSIVIIVLAALPFVIRILVIASGVTGYVLHSSYKLVQLMVPVWWRYRAGVSGWKVLWPVEEPWPGKKIWGQAIGLAAGLALAGIAATILISGWLGMDAGEIQEKLNERFAIASTGAMVIVVLLATLNAGLEELHFRYWLDREIAKIWGAGAGIFFSAALFGLMHLLILAGTGVLNVVGQAAVFLAVMIAGASWSLLARQPGGIHAAWLSHGLTNVILMGWGLYWLGYV